MTNEEREQRIKELEERVRELEIKLKDCQEWHKEFLAILTQRE